jgi:gluconolactonase
MNPAVSGYTGCRWSEGPAWIGDQRCLLWSDILNNRIPRWDEKPARHDLRKPSNNANGNIRDRQGASSPASTACAG